MKEDVVGGRLRRVPSHPDMWEKNSILYAAGSVTTFDHLNGYYSLPLAFLAIRFSKRIPGKRGGHSTSRSPTRLLRDELGEQHTI